MRRKTVLKTTKEIKITQIRRKIFLALIFTIVTSFYFGKLRNKEYDSIY